jgi:hypothetical protein
MKRSMQVPKERTIKLTTNDLEDIEVNSDDFSEVAEEQEAEAYTLKNVAEAIIAPPEEFQRFFGNFCSRMIKVRCDY